MAKQVKAIFQTIIYLFKRVIAGSIRFRKENINFNQEKELITNSLIDQGFRQVSAIKKPNRIGATLKKKLDKSIFLSGLVQNLAYIKSSISTAPANVFSSKSLKLNYFRIPKVASTSMLETMISKDFAIDTSKLSQKQIDVIGGLLLQNRIYSKELDFQNLAIVRNPLSRIYSAYKSIFLGPSENFIYENYLFGIFNKEMSFHQFVNALINIPTALADYHFKPQYDLIFDHQHVDEVKIFKMEEIDTCLVPYLKSEFNITFPHLNKSQIDSSPFEQIYSLETASKVYKYYYRDFNFFNYNEDFNNLLLSFAQNGNK